MKKIIIFLSFLPVSLFSQIKVHSTGDISIGGETTPRSTLDINKNTTTTATAQFGMFGIQSFTDVNGFITGNSFWNGSAMEAYAEGNISLLQFLDGAIMFRTSSTVAAGGTASGSSLYNNIVAKDNGYVGINMPNDSRLPSYPLHVTGDAAKTSGGADWIVISDRRLKKNIIPFTDGLSNILKMEPYFFEYTGEAGTNIGEEYVGLMAQDMQDIAPYTVKKYWYTPTKETEEMNLIIDKENSKEYLALDNTAVRYMLVNAIKEQQVLIEKLEKQIQELGSKVEFLSAKINYDLTEVTAQKQ